LAERNPEADSRHALLADPSRPAANNGFSRHFVEQTTGTIHPGSTKINKDGLASHKHLNKKHLFSLNFNRLQ